MKLSRTFQRFFDSEKATGILLIACTAASLLFTNSALGPDYLAFWSAHLGGLSVAEWINDALMAIFFLLIGLELKREFLVGELSDGRTALLPIVAALGGVVLPALIHFGLNRGTVTQPGAGIPMATDIAFALGILGLLGSRVPASLKVFLTALAVMDDLAAMVVIAVFYTAHLSLGYLAAAIGLLGLLLLINRVFKVVRLAPYLLAGAVLWFLMMRSGVHATIAGVLLAFVIPSSGKRENESSPSHRLEHALQRPVAFLILPLFALANTALPLSRDWIDGLGSANSLGILLGLTLGKPIGIALATAAAVGAGISRLPADLGWRQVIGLGLLGGIGFTMSIFITNLAFGDQDALVESSKIAIMAASMVAGGAGYFWLRGVRG